MTYNAALTLKRAFDPFFEAPLEAWLEFAGHCTPVSYPKDHVLKAAGQRERHFYFLIRGSMGVFLWKENNFVCLDFAFEGHFVGDYMSLLTGQPNPLQTVALEPLEALRIGRDDYLRLGQTPVGQVLTRAAAESTFIAKQQQQIDLLTKTARQRYDELLARYPDITQRVAQKHIASYLGITPQSLSRIRRH